MTFTLFLLLRLRKQLEYDINPLYLWGYMLFAAIVPTTVAILVTLLRHIDLATYNCYAEQPILTVFDVTVAFMIFMQVIFLLLAMKAIHEVVNAVKSSSCSKNDIRLLYMITRFSLSVVAEVIALSGYYAYTIKPSFQVSIIRSLMWDYSVGELLDALILLFGNQNLWRKVLPKLKRLTSRYRRGTKVTDSPLDTSTDLPMDAITT